jgi:hypothetical protein
MNARAGGVASRGALASAAVLLLASALAGSSQASFNSRDENRASGYAFTALYAPASLTATPAGHDVDLGWGAGTNGNGYQVLGVGNGTSSNCSTAPFAGMGTTSGTSDADLGRYTPQGTWFCYQVKTSYGVWTSVSSNPTAAAQLGVVATSVTVANGGQANRLDTGDTITVTFNQAINTAGGPAASDTVCTVNGGTIMLASTTTTGGCSTGEAVDLGTLNGGSSNRSARFDATYAWSNGSKTLTVTIGARTSGSQNPNVSGTWTLDPTTTATRLLSAIGSFHTCDTNTGGGNCLPTVSGGF